MYGRLMQRSVVSNKTVAQFCAAACSIVGVAVLLLGFRRIEQMELTESQLYSATTETFLLTAGFVALALIFHQWRRTA